MMTNVRMKTCLNQKIIKISNLIQAMKNSVCPKTKVIRRPNFSENRICPNFPNYEFNTRHDNREVTLIEFFESRICPNIYFRKPNLSEYLPNVPKCGLNTRHDNREVTWSDVKRHLFSFSESRICPNIYRMFRSVDWTHDMIIVKWHLFIWHERKLCALTSAPPVQSTQMSQWLSTLFHANCSAAQVYVLHPGQFIFALSSRRRSFL